jgi:hypothetical protein
MAYTSYGGVDVRESTDLDILIKRRDVHDAKKALLQHGYITDLPDTALAEEV